MTIASVVFVLHRPSQTFELSLTDYKGPEFRTHATRKMPTFGRRQIWLHKPGGRGTRSRPAPEGGQT